MATPAQARQQAHKLIDRLPPAQVDAAVGLLEKLTDPVSHAIRNAPFEDVPESQSERDAVAASKAWLEAHPNQGVTFDEILNEHGLKSEDLRK